MSEIQASQVKYLSNTQLEELAKKYNIDSTLKGTELTKKIINSIMATADGARDKMLDKKEEYYAAKEQFNIFAEKKEKTYSEFKSAQSKVKNGTGFETAKAKYASACSSYSDSDIRVSVLLNSLQDSIFFSGKMNTSACIANAALG